MQRAPSIGARWHNQGSRTMSKLTNYLQNIESVTECAEITLFLDGRRYAGAAYRDSNFSGARYYLLGELPPSYRRSRRVAYVIDRADWYIAAYTTNAILATLDDATKKYHPSGEYFLLCKWDIPSGDKIDSHELRPYRRVPALVRPGNATLDGMINLDCYSTDSDELLQWWSRYSVNQRTRGAELFPDRPAGYVRATRDLANYAANKATAMKCRAFGDIGSAQMYESICERIFAGLPSYARW